MKQDKYHEVQKQIFDPVHPILLKIKKNDKLSWLIYISLHHIDKRIRHIDYLPHTQNILAHQLTRIH